ncbi:MAG: hypothetical protein VZQ83_11170, partial [Eubacterium sp.]|nr:hypothetical protein [Eubacterium sp.]
DGENLGNLHDVYSFKKFFPRVRFALSRYLAKILFFRKNVSIYLILRPNAIFSKFFPADIFGFM